MNQKTGTITIWGQKKCLPVDPESPEVQRTFTRGQCASFARAIHALTGWPLVVMCYGEDGYGEIADPAGDGDHVVVRHPDGGLVDIFGRWQKGERWGDLEILVDVSEDEVADLGWDVQNPKAALPFARALLDALDTPTT